MSDAGSDYGQGDFEDEEPLVLEEAVDEDQEMAPEDALRIVSHGDAVRCCLYKDPAMPNNRCRQQQRRGFQWRSGARRRT